MINILFVVPYPELKPAVEEVYINHPLKSSFKVKFLVMSVDDVRNFKMDDDYDVLVGRNFTLKELKRLYPHKAIIDIPITGYDIVRVIYESKQKFNAKRIGIIGRFYNVYGFENLEEIMDCELRYYRPSKDADIPDCVRQAKEDGCDSVIGGYSVHLLVKDNGLNSAVIEVGRETIYKVFNEAIHIALAVRKEREQAEMFRIITQTSKNGILYINNKKELIIVNPEARKYFSEIGRNISHKSILKIAPYMKESIETCLLTGELMTNKLFLINNVTISADFNPIKVEGRVIGLVISFQDITDIQKLENQIRKRLSDKGLNAKYTFDSIIHKSDVLDNAITIAKKYSAVSSNILIVGETGTGKELFAQSIHNASDRKNSGFVAVNCAALPENLLESELFGYADGAFTGSKKGGKTGLFELAHKGTLFLDEISEVPLSFQSKLLRVLQEREVRRIGGDSVISIDVRIIAATNKNIKKMVEEGTFRQDLLYRIDVLEVFVPPLRKRNEDMILLFEYYLDQFYNKTGTQIPELTEEAKAVLREYDFPGNIRELKNIAERVSVLCNEKLIYKKEIFDAIYSEGIEEYSIHTFSNKNPLENIIKISEQEKIEKALSLFDNKNEVAKYLGMDRTTLWRKMKKYGLH